MATAIGALVRHPATLVGLSFGLMLSNFVQADYAWVAFWMALLVYGAYRFVDAFDEN